MLKKSAPLSGTDTQTPHWSFAGIITLAVVTVILASCNGAPGTTGLAPSAGTSPSAQATDVPGTTPTSSSSETTDRLSADATAAAAVSPTAPTEARTTSIPAMEGATPAAANTSLIAAQQAAEGVMRQFTAAINRGDAGAVADLFVPDARFDSVGRIYESRDQIMNRFLIPEVINVGGQYQLLRVQHDPDSVIVEYNFRTQSGGFEHFTYDCTVREGLIRDCVGRYAPTNAPTAIATPASLLSAGAPDGNRVPTAAQCYIDAVNNGDLDGLVTCFAPDGVVIDVSRRISGRDAIRSWANNEVIGGRLQVIEIAEQREGHVRLLVHWAPAGASGWRAYYTFEYQNGVITQVDLQYA